MPRATFFTIDIDGTPRVIFSIQKRAASGDLTLILKHEGSHHDIGGTYDFPSIENTVLEHRISIHQSPESENINAIVHTKNLKDGKRLQTRNFTRAIKITNRFAPLLMERCPNLSLPRKKANTVKRPDDPQVSLGWYAPHLFQLVYGVFVGRADRIFSLYSKHDIRLQQERIGSYRIVVIWSFIGLPSDRTENNLPFRTYRPEEIETMPDPELRKFLRDATDGFDDESCEVLYRHYRGELLDQYFRGLDKTVSEDDRQNLLPKMRAIARFFPYGDPASPDFIDHFRRLRLRFPGVENYLPRMSAGIKSDKA